MKWYFSYLIFKNFPSPIDLIKSYKIWTRDKILWKSEDKGGWLGFFQYALGIVLSSYTCSLCDNILVLTESLHILASWLCPAQQPKKVNQKVDQTTKPDRIQEVWTRVDRKWSIWTCSRAEEKPKIRYWSADSWPNFLQDNSKNYLIFSHNGLGAENIAQRKAPYCCALSQTQHRRMSQLLISWNILWLVGHIGLLYHRSFILSKPAVVPERASNFPHPSNLIFTHWKKERMCFGEIK